MNFGTISGPPGWNLYCGGPVGPEGFTHDDDATGWLLRAVKVYLSMPSPGGSLVEEFAALLAARKALLLEVYLGGAAQVTACLFDFDEQSLEVAGKPLPGGPIQVRLVPSGAVPAGLQCMISLKAQPCRES